MSRPVLLLSNAVDPPELRLERVLVQVEFIALFIYARQFIYLNSLVCSVG